MVQPQAEGHQEPAEAGRDEEEPFPEPAEGTACGRLDSGLLASRPVREQISVV